MNSASISADIISYTSLSSEDKRNIESEIKKLINLLTDKYKGINFFGRIIKGDYIECAIDNSSDALRIALLLKTFIKSIDLKNSTNIKGIKYFKEHAIRLAVAIAPLNIIDPVNGIIDGEAIYMSGRAIQDYSTSDKQKIVIKNTMFFCNQEDNIKELYDTIFSLLDNIISRCSAKQSQVIYFRLLGLSEKEISQKLNKNQSTISQHSTSAGWHSIERAINFFENNVN